MSINDDEIEKRLQKLREAQLGQQEDESAHVDREFKRQQSLLLQREIEIRLAKLTERDPSFYTSSEPPIKVFSIQANRRQTNEEKADELITRYVQELHLDEARGQLGEQRDEEIEARLRQLIANSTDPALADAYFKQHQQEQYAKVVQQSASPSSVPKVGTFKRTGELIHKLLSWSPSSVNEDEEEEEEVVEHALNTGSEDPMDWCATCNEDGVLRCIDCDHDIYCRECFRELHTDADMRKHRTMPYRTKSKS